jgi:hypothetical protein
VYLASASDWHRARAAAQRNMPTRVLECGATILTSTCVGCGVVKEIRLGCRNKFLCYPCRASIAYTKRKAYLRARDSVLGEARVHGRFKSNRRGGAWFEKFLTLTAPHVSTDTVSVRISRILEAWPLFLRRLNRYFKERGLRSVEWFRVFEWTPGSDENGHPHFHVWIFSPFLPQELLAQYWESSLLDAGCPPDLTIGKTVPYIERLNSDGKRAADELIKYLLKDISSGGEKLDPALYSQVMIALDGHRVTQASRGFMGRAKEESARCECGCELPKTVHRSKAPAPEELSRG